MDNTDSTITFAPSDIDSNSAPAQAAAPVQQNQTPAPNAPITFSPSDIDHDVPPVAAPTSVKPSLWDRVKGDAQSLWNYTHNNGTAIASGGASAASAGTPVGVMGASSSVDVKQAAKDTAIGAAKSVGQTLNTVGGLIIPNKVVDAVAGDGAGEAADKNADQEFALSNPDQKAGAVLETIAEFVAGDAALDSLSLGEKFSQVGKITKFMEANPRIAAATVNGIKNAVLGGAIGGAHGGVQGAETGALLGGTVGAVTGGLSPDVPEPVEPTPDVVPETTTPAQNAADEVATTNAAKAPISKGAPAVSADEAPTVQDVQPQVHQAIKDAVNEQAAEDGLKPLNPETSGQDAFHELGDQYQARAKAGYAQIKNATGVDINELGNQISDLKDKIGDAVGEPDKIERLQEQLVTKQQVMDTAKVQAEKAGLDPDQPGQDWKSYKASYDVGNKVRAASDGDVIDPNKLSPRLDKAMNNKYPGQAGRLQQVVGEDRANNLMDQINQQRGAIKDFEPTTATGQQAMKDLIRPNTGTGRVQAIKQALGFEPKTNWIGTYSDMSKLPPEEMTARFGADAPAAKAFVQAQAKNQVIKMAAKGLGVAAIGHLLGIDKAAIHFILE